MLVLTRGKDETIMIGDQIEVTVLEVRGDRVRIGIRAPQEVTIHRKEVFLAIRDANLEASRADAAGIERLRDLAPEIAPKPAPPDEKMIPPGGKP